MNNEISNSESHSQLQNQANDTPNLESYAAEIDSLANEARSKLVPQKSKPLYYTQYNKLMKWCEEKHIVNIDQTVMLAYFHCLSKNYQASTLWTTYSKLKCMLLFKQRKDIGKYVELQSFLSNLMKTHVPKKAEVFTNEEVREFLQDAPDKEYLLHKVVLIFGLHGCLRKIEFLNIQKDDVKQHGEIFQVFIKTSKTNKSKSFFTSEEFYPMIKKYVQLRPDCMQRFFVQCRGETCTKQNVGKGKVGQIPKEIAKFSHLLDVDKYTGHAFRRTSATLIVDEGANMETLKRHGVWASNTVAEEYINDSVRSKKAVTKLMSSAISYNKKDNTPESVKIKVATVTSGSLHGLKFSNDNGLQVAKSSNRKEFQYRSKASTKKVLCDENVNPNKSTSLASKPAKLTQVQCDEYENITQEELQEVVSTGFHQNLPSTSKQFESQYNNATSKNHSTTKILAEIENISQAELEEVVSFQFEDDLHQDFVSISKTQKENQKSEENFYGMTRGHLNSIFRN